MDITLDNVLTFLDEHYNNVKVLDTLNQELFQLWMADKETVSDWGVCLSRHLQVLAASFPNHFPPDWVAELKRDHFYGRLPTCLKVMVAYLKVGPQVRTDYIRATWELPQGSKAQVTDTPPKPRPTSFFPLRKLSGNQPILKCLLCIWHIWKKRMPEMMKAKRVMILAGLKELWKSSWYTWQGPLRTPKHMENAATIVIALNISSAIAPW